MVDPPLAGAPATFSFADGPAARLRPTLTVRGEPGEPPILYPLVPVARANSVTHAAV